MTLATQTEAVLRLMRERGAITALDALNEAGCFRLAARIADLRAAGHAITSTMVVLPVSGKRVASYSLAGTPQEPAGRPVRPGKPLVALPPTPEEDDRFTGLIEEVAQADITLRCTRCGNEARLSILRSRFGPPQYLNHMAGAAVYEVTCPEKSCPSRKRSKGLEAIYREVTS